MAIFCVPRHLVEKLKTSALAGEVNIKKLNDMSSSERREFFNKHTNPELGKLINTEFEKALISNQKTALTDWAKSVFKPVARKDPSFKTMLDKINSLDEMGVLNPKSKKSFLEDLVADRLGISVSPEEVKAISKKAKVIDEAQIKLGDDLGSPVKLDENLEFFKAKKQMDDYLESLNPASKLRIATGTIGRGVMLASVKSPVLNIGSNIEIGLTESIARRLSGGGLVNADRSLAREYVKMVNKVYQKTGYDLSRMTTLADTGASGARVLDDTVHAQGKGLLRKTGRVVEDTVFKQLMGAPDVAFASRHFASSVGTGALKMAKGNRQMASDIMKDAMRIEPRTPQGEVLRSQGILDAQFATWTNKSWASDVSLGIRKIFNGVSGDLRLGDYLLPFVKTPANVISTGADYAGLGIPKALIKTIQGIRKGNIGDRETIQGISRDLVRSGLGITGAVILAAQFKPQDFVGAYDPARKQIEELRNSKENSVRVGDKWINMAWFGPLAVPLTAMMYAKKYGNSPASNVFEYGKGIGMAILDLPGIDVAKDIISSQEKSEDKDLEESAGEAIDYVTEQIYSRLVPSIIADTAKATDEFERAGGKGLSGIKAKIPGLRQSLPIKQDVFGEQLKTESPISVILFGSRVKTSKESPVVAEVDRVLTTNDKNTTFTDWSKSNSKVLAQFNQKVGNDEYKKATADYGQTLKQYLEKGFNGDEYKKMDDQQKLKFISNADTKATEEVFKKYKFKYKRG